MPNIKGTTDLEWHFEIEGDGMPVLFIHGWGVDRRIWRQQTKYFSDHYKVISVDLPGHGNTPWKDVTLETIADDINVILEFLSVDKISIVGSSLGGLVSLKYFELYPDKVKQLAFVGSMPKFSKSDDYPYGLDIEQMKKLDGYVESDYPDIVHVFFRSLFTKQERQTRRYKWLEKFRKFDKVPMQNALQHYLDILENEDLRHVLKTVSVPMQFINGTHDEICTMKSMEIVKELAPSAEFDFFEDCGHFPFLSKAYEFNDSLHEFLKRNA